MWEAILDPSVAELGEIVWIVDMNRQSLDRVVPNRRRKLATCSPRPAGRCSPWRSVARWNASSPAPGGDALRRRILDMPNPEYQRLLRCSGPELRDRLPGDGRTRGPSRRCVADLDDDALVAAIANLGGHDIDALRDAYPRSTTRPTVILAYTVKGFGLPIQGHRRTTRHC